MNSIKAQICFRNVIRIVRLVLRARRYPGLTKAILYEPFANIKIMTRVGGS
jgi:hypothetical protein